MDLHHTAREFYTQQIDTSPATEDWQASFDNGDTWHDGEAVPGQTDQWRWLVAGPDYDGDDETDQVELQPVAPSKVIYPLLKCVDDPEVLVRVGTRIEITG